MGCGGIGGFRGLVEGFSWVCRFGSEEEREVGFMELVI